MNRRAFVSSLAAFAAGAAFDPEKLLWVPGRKLISIPAPQPLVNRMVIHYADGYAAEWSTAQRDWGMLYPTIQRWARGAPENSCIHRTERVGDTLFVWTEPLRLVSGKGESA